MKVKTTCVLLPIWPIACVLITGLSIVMAAVECLLHRHGVIGDISGRLTAGCYRCAHTCGCWCGS